MLKPGAAQVLHMRQYSACNLFLLLQLPSFYHLTRQHSARLLSGCTVCSRDKDKNNANFICKLEIAFACSWLSLWTQNPQIQEVDYILKSLLTMSARVCTVGILQSDELIYHSLEYCFYYDL